MPETYFTKFPKINYSNNNVIDITLRTKLIDSVGKNPFIFYPYTIENNERPDQLAETFYSDPYLGWNFFICNKIIDPYYGWYMTNESFNDFINIKYGEINNAVSIIKYYRVNWFKDDTILNQRDYDILGIQEKKYWIENPNENVKGMMYKRKELDWDINTNMVIKYTLSNSINVKENDIIKIKIKSYTIGTGTVVYNSDNQLILQHISDDAFEHDDIQRDSNSYLYLNSDDSISSIITNIEIITQNIPLSEYKYWEPVTALDEEIEKNEYNKSLKILDESYIITLANNLKKSLNG